MMAYSYADEKHLISKELFEEKMDAVIAAASSYPVDDTWEAEVMTVEDIPAIRVRKSFATETELWQYAESTKNDFLKFGYYTVIATVTSSYIPTMPVGAKASLSLQSFQQMPSGVGSLFMATLKVYIPGSRLVVDKTSVLTWDDTVNAVYATFDIGD